MSNTNGSQFRNMFMNAAIWPWQGGGGTLNKSFELSFPLFASDLTACKVKTKILPISVTYIAVALFAPNPRLVQDLSHFRDELKESFPRRMGESKGRSSFHICVHSSHCSEV